MTQKFEDILYEVRGRAAWIIINRPKLYNAFRAQTIEEMISAFKLAADDRNVSSVVLTGAGDKAFCTGGDQSAHEGQYDGRGIVGLPIDELQSFIRDIPKPVIARINGFAIGGGNVFATLCDLSIMSESAKLGQVGPKVGSVDAGWGTALLARHVGERLRTRRALAGEGGHGIRIHVVDDAFVPVVHEAAHDVRAHSSESDHSQLHS